MQRLSEKCPLRASAHIPAFYRLCGDRRNMRTTAAIRAYRDRRNVIMTMQSRRPPTVGGMEKGLKTASKTCFFRPFCIVTGA